MEKIESLLYCKQEHPYYYNCIMKMKYSHMHVCAFVCMHLYNIYQSDYICINIPIY